MQRRLVHQRDLLAQLEDAVLPIALRAEPGERGGKCRIGPALADPCGVVDQAQRAKCLEQMKLATVEARRTARNLRARRRAAAPSTRGRRRAASTSPGSPARCARRRSRRSAGRSSVHSTLPAWQSPCSRASRRRRPIVRATHAVRALAALTPRIDFAQVVGQWSCSRSHARGASPRLSMSSFGPCANRLADPVA